MLEPTARLFPDPGLPGPLDFHPLDTLWNQRHESYRYLETHLLSFKLQQLSNQWYVKRLQSNAALRSFSAQLCHTNSSNHPRSDGSAQVASYGRLTVYSHR